MDVFTREQRSEIMSRIRSGDTKPELAVRRLLHHAGYRFRIHVRKMPGQPDIVLARYRTAIFVHGCFWHGHDCQRGRVPKTNPEYWAPKLRGNVERDLRHRDALATQGWRSFVVWSCELRDPEHVLAELDRALRNASAASTGK